MTDSASPLPLAGLRVLDLTRVLAGPFATMILADLGADVVKIERPPGGDDARHFGPFLPSGLSAYFASINRGKRSVVLDLKQPDDRRTFLSLVERADVLVENFRPGTLEGLDLSAAELARTNPRLIYASASGFGRVGPDCNRPAYDAVIQALSGLMSITGSGPGEPVRVGTSIADLVTGLFTVVGILAALRNREQHAHVADVDIAMLDATVAMLENAVARYEVTGEVPVPLGTRHPSIAPFQAFEAADGPLVIAAGNDVLWQRLCTVLEAPQLAADPRLATNASRVERVTELAAELNRRLAARPRDVWLERLAAAGIPAAPIRGVDEVVRDPQLIARGMLHAVDDGAGHCLTTPGSPLRLGGAALPLAPRAPRLGEHTAQVLDEWLGE